MVNDEDDLADFALPPKVDEFQEEKLQREFQPWHKPRKQWVRKFVLLRHVRDLIRTLSIPADSRYFRYLSLPGDDLLDIRALAPMIHRRELQMHYIGFNSVGPGSRREIQLNLAENELKGRPEIYRNSAVFRDRLETIGHDGGMQLSRLRSVGPFHAINIDLCDHVGRNQRTPTYIDAIGKIVELQTQSARDPWLLFLSTCVHPDYIHADNLTAFIQAIRSNIAESEPFAGHLTNVLLCDGQELENTLQNVAAIDRDQFRKFFTVGFGKWLLRYLATAIPQGRLSLLRSCHYEVTDENVDMLTLAFRCDPVVAPAVDPVGLVASGGAPPAAHYDESQAAIELLNNVENMVPIDNMLAERPDLYHEVMDETQTLLEQANYPIEDYIAWLKDNDPLSHLIVG